MGEREILSDDYGFCKSYYHINKTDHHDITEILLKVALNTIKPTKLLPYNHTHCRSQQV